MQNPQINHNPAGVKLLIGALLIGIPLLTFFLGTKFSEEKTFSQTANLESLLKEEPSGLDNLQSTPDLGLEPINPNSQKVGWQKICGMSGVEKSFTVRLQPGEGVAYAGKKTVQAYLGAAIRNAPEGQRVTLSTSEQSYAEDFLRKEIQKSGSSQSAGYEIPCELAEEAVITSLKLSAAEKENLQKYGGSVDPAQFQQWLDDMVENSSQSNPLRPQVVGY